MKQPSSAKNGADAEAAGARKRLGEGWRYPSAPSFLKRLLFLDVDPLVNLGYRTRLEVEHMCEEPSVETKYLITQLEPAWQEQLNLPKPDLKRALLRGNWGGLLYTAVLYLLAQACSLAGPLLLRRIVGGLQCAAAQKKVPVDIGCQPLKELYFYIIGLFIAPVIQSLCENQQTYVLYLLGTRMRNSLMAAIYRKCLRLSNGAMQAESTGRVVTLMSNDAQKLQDAMMAIHALWGSPLYIIAILALLWFEVGWATFVGLGVMLALVPLTGMLAAKLGGLRREILQWTDKRVGRMNELINGIQMIKFYAWEPSFKAEVMKCREQEAIILRKSAAWQGAFGMLLFSGPVLVAIFCFGSFTLAGNELTTARAYTALALFNLLRFPMSFLPMLITMIVNALVAVKRISGFLKRDEVDTDACDMSVAPGTVTISDATFAWEAPPPNAAENKPGGPGGPGGPGAAAGKRGGKGKDKAADAGKDGKGGPPVASDAKAHAAKNGDAVAVDVAEQVEAAPAEPPPATLRNIDLSTSSGQLVMVVGGVGSGKSSLLSALIGGIPKKQGGVAIGGRVAYVAQSAWIMNDTLQENVLCGAPLDPERYSSALRVSQLGPDLQILPNGDLTEIGDRGITLSGGQKQRVSIARAIYYDADVYLLDDPLSAVDSHVGKALFDEVIRGALRSKTIILVTNALQYLPHADTIVWLDGGEVKAQGSYQQLLDAGLNIAELAHDEVEEANEADAEKASKQQTIPEDSASTSSPVPDDDDDAISTPSSGATPRGAATPLAAEVAAPGATKDGAASAASAAGAEKVSGGGAPAAFSAALRQTNPGAAGEAEAATGKDVLGGAVVPATAAKAAAFAEHGKITLTRQAADANRNLTGVEAREEGAVSGKVVTAYVMAGGGLILVVSLLLMFSLEQGARVYTDTWVGNWFGDKFDRDTWFYLGIYFMLGVVYGLITYARSLNFLFGCVRATLTLHNKLLDHILQLPKSFFDTNPAGRILNRFSRDVDIMDSTLPNSLIQFAGCVATYIAILVVITIATKWFGIALVPLTAIYFGIQRYYIPAARELQRIESITRSPIYSRFAEAMAGVATIRAFRFESHFTSLSDRLMETNAYAFVTMKLASGWLAMRLDILGLCVLTLAGALCIQGNIEPGMAGLALVYALDLTRFLKHGTAMASKSEADLNSVERIVQYLEPTTEAAAETDPRVMKELGLDDSWPQSGAIEVSELCMRYRPEMPLVLRGITFKVAAGEKVGLVGRTGSGKSSILLAMFRMIEAESGVIRIDGIDISRLGLRHLRSKMSIIPQDPFMFSGSVRHNLDPFSAHSDEELWQVIDAVGLQPAIAALPDQLGAKVVDNGSNFSLGQRQLFCLARAMLRKSRVLMLDEATASVDVDTDAHIQAAIRLRFGDVTCLTIAHRLNTIMDADRVVVLEAGRVIENDEPSKLLELAQGIFTGMVDQTGKSSSRYLKGLARYASKARTDGIASGSPRATVPYNRVHSVFGSTSSFVNRKAGTPGSSAYPGGMGSRVSTANDLQALAPSVDASEVRPTIVHMHQPGSNTAVIDTAASGSSSSVDGDSNSGPGAAPAPAAAQGGRSAP